MASMVFPAPHFVDLLTNGVAGLLHGFTCKIVRKIKGAGGCPCVFGLGDEVQRSRRCCSFRSRLRQNEKVIIGLERSSVVFGF